MVKLTVDEELIRLRAGYIRGRYLREDKVRRNQMVRLGLIKMGSIHRFVFPRLEDAGGDDVIEW